MTRIESELLNSESMIKSFFNGIPIPTYVWQKVSNDLILIDFKEAFSDITRGGIKKCVGMRATEFYKNLFTHDISNILTVIDWSFQLFSKTLQKQDSFGDLKENIVRIKEQINRAKNLIKNIQKLSKFDATKKNLKNIEVNKILKDCVNYIYDSYKKKTLKIEIDSMKTTYFAYADELLGDVFENILINGINHNQNEVAEINIKISEEETRGKSFLKLEFRDNGVGIPDERKEMIFQKRFEKNENTKGMGFGLTLVKKIIDNYKGEIWIEDRIKGDYKQGSNFVVLIPLS